MIKLEDLYLFDRDFASDDELLAAIAKKDSTLNLKAQLVPPLQLLFYKTSKQRSYLFAYPSSIYCVTDNRLSRAAPRCIWGLSVKDAMKSKIEVWQDESYVAIGESKPRRYSPELFKLAPIERQIAAMIRAASKIAA